MKDENNGNSKLKKKLPSQRSNKFASEKEGMAQAFQDCKIIKLEAKRV